MKTTLVIEVIVYSVSQVGQYHLDAGSDICQDAKMIKRISDKVTAIAVADGVGSQKHSEIASSIAVSKCIEYLSNNIDKNEDVQETLKLSFYTALYAIEDEYSKKGSQMEDCTLCVAVITPKYVYCGQSGDSGALGLRRNGDYVALTEKQNDDEGRVYTLRWTDRWVFSRYDNDFVSVLLATDGFYDWLFPDFMKESEIFDPKERMTRFDYENASRFMDIRTMGDFKSDSDLGDCLLQRINSIPRKGADSIDDDLTLAVAIDEKASPRTSKKFSAKIERDVLKKKLFLVQMAGLYPDKKIVETKNGVYLSEDTLVCSPGRSVKSVYGGMLQLCYEEGYLKHLFGKTGKHDFNAIRKRIENSVQSRNDVPSSVLSPFDCLSEEKELSLFAKTPSIMGPLRTFIKSRAHSHDELAKISDGLIEAVKSIHSTDFEPAAYDPDEVFVDVNGNVMINCYLNSLIPNVKKERDDSRIATSVAVLIRFVLSDGDEMAVDDPVIFAYKNKLKSVFGYEGDFSKKIEKPPAANKVSPEPPPEKTAESEDGGVLSDVQSGLKDGIKFLEKTADEVGKKVSRRFGLSKK